MTYHDAIEIIEHEMVQRFPSRRTSSDYMEARAMAVEALKMVAKSKHKCLRCANNREGVCESQDIIACSHYERRNQ